MATRGYRLTQHPARFVSLRDHGTANGRDRASDPWRPARKGCGMGEAGASDPRPPTEVGPRPALGREVPLMYMR